MIDYIPTEYVELPDGRRVLRYAEYNADGSFKEYRYFEAAGEPDTSKGEPTPIARGTLLKGATAEAYGLDADLGVPDDALAALAFASQHTWVRCRAYDTAVTTQIGMVSLPGTAYTVYYADQLQILADGTFKATTQKSVSVSYNTYTNANVLKGKYWSRSSLTSGSRTVYYTPADVADASRSTTATSGIVFNVVSISSGLCMAATGFEAEALYSQDITTFDQNISIEGYNTLYLDKFNAVPISAARAKFSSPQAHVSGVYAGNGDTFRNFVLGRQPIAVLIMCADSLIAQNTIGRYGFSVTNSMSQSVVITPTGFQIMPTSTYLINIPGSTYDYIAFF